MYVQCMIQAINKRHSMHNYCKSQDTSRTMQKTELYSFNIDSYDKDNINNSNSDTGIK